MSIESVAQRATPFVLQLHDAFRDGQTREGLLIHGSSGWGEFAPFQNYDDDLAGRWLAGALEAAFGQWPTPIRQAVPVNAIIPAVSVERAREIATRAVIQFGMTTFKVKVGKESFVDDVARVRAVRDVCEALHVVPKIRIDVNAQWTVAQAQERLPVFDDNAHGLDYVEQPCATLDEHRQLRELTSTRIAIDEGLRLADSIDALARDVEQIRQAADVLVVKAIPLGGLRHALRIIEAIDLPAVVSGSLDSSVGLASGLALASCIRNLDGACGLGTGTLLANDLTATTLLPKDGMLSVERTVPDSEQLAQARNRMDSKTQQQWIHRMMNAWYASAQSLVSADVRAAVEEL